MQLTQVNNIKIEEIITALNNGAVLVLPTDTVYGLVCDAENKEAVEKIYKIKNRSESNPLPVFVKNIEMAKKLAFVDNIQKKFLEKNWPGAVTVVLRRKSDVKLYGVEKETIALRMPKYEFLNKVLEGINRPLAQTSANISRKPATTKISDILEQFGLEDVIIIDAGNLSENKPSAIFNLTGNHIEIIRK